MVSATVKNTHVGDNCTIKATQAITHANCFLKVYHFPSVIAKNIFDFHDTSKAQPSCAPYPINVDCQGAADIVMIVFAGSQCGLVGTSSHLCTWIA